MLFKFRLNSVKLAIYLLLSYAFKASIFQLTGVYIAKNRMLIKKAIEPVIFNKVELSDDILLARCESNAQALR